MNTHAYSNAKKRPLKCEGRLQQVKVNVYQQSEKKRLATCPLAMYFVSTTGETFE